MAAGWGLVAAIVWLSLTPQPPEIDFEAGDKLGHLAAYGILMLWFCVLYRRARVRAAYAIGFVALGIALEFLQESTGYRTFEALDIAANAGGVLLGWGVGTASSVLR